MNSINRLSGDLHVEGVACADLASRYGTPLYVYSRSSIEQSWHAFDQAFNSNLGVLNLLGRLGSGFDIVSAGELERVRAAGCDLSKVVFSGVGKSPDEMATALSAGIKCFNVESESEIIVLADVARAHGVTAPVSVRINPDVDAGTHPYISTGLKENKFGINADVALNAYRQIADNSHLEVVGMDCHIGSQLTEIAPYQDALQRLLLLVDALQDEGIMLSHLDLGGGQGIRYRDEIPIDLSSWAQAMNEVDYR